VGWPLAHHLARLAARETGGLILDRRSERFWSLDRWAGVDIDPRQAAIGDWVAIHDVADTAALTRMHTHGMLHFGLPDLELVGVPRFYRACATRLVSAACLKLFVAAFSEDSALRVGDELTISGENVHAALSCSKESEAGDGLASIRLVAGDPQAAKIENRLLRIVPAARYGQGTEGLASCLLDLFPDEIGVLDVADPNAMHSARCRALATLGGEIERFRRGLRSGEQLAVKVRFPFGQEGAHEYMWVEVRHCSGDEPHSTIDGVLLNRPLHRADLRVGQRLRVEQRAIYDWLRITTGGRHEGNFTAAALR